MGRGGGQVVSVLALFLRQYEFESRCSLQFFCEIVVDKNEKRKKRPELANLKNTMTPT